MIPSSSVELTRVHFFDPNRYERNIEIPTISREVFQNSFNTNTIIKKNIFGHKWVLKINENQDDEKEKCSGKVIVYIWVFCCIIVAISFGIYFSVESKFFGKKHVEDIPIYMVPNKNVTKILDNNFKDNELISKGITGKVLIINLSTTKATLEETEYTTEIAEDNFFTSTQKSICNNCINNEEICLKTEEFHAPICARIKDNRDPSGCGGLCELNIQHCKKLHSEINVFQCVKNKNVLHCPSHSFNCGNMCIPRNRRCDGIIHCSNMADEKNCECDMNSYFHCGNGTSCIEIERKCNGIIDCWDKSDETDCNRACEPNEIPCSNGQCIKKEYFCDGVYHCLDKSDEPQGC